MRQDFILDSEGDFPLEDIIVNGIYQSTPYGDSDNQHIEDLLFYQIGWNKRVPVSGFGVNSYISSEKSLQNVEKNINTELEKDGYLSRNGVVSPVLGGGFEINARFIYAK